MVGRESWTVVSGRVPGPVPPSLRETRKGTRWCHCPQTWSGKGAEQRGPHRRPGLAGFPHDATGRLAVRRKLPHVDLTLGVSEARLSSLQSDSAPGSTGPPAACGVRRRTLSPRGHGSLVTGDGAFMQREAAYKATRKVAPATTAQGAAVPSTPKAPKLGDDSA